MRKIGRTVSEVLPSSKYPRNTEGAFAELKNGDILFAFSRFLGNSNDESAAEIAAVISHDDGETFGEERRIIEKTEGDENLMSVSFLRMLDGALGIFYLRKFTSETGKSCCIPYISKSYDEGQSFGKPKRCIQDDDYYVLNNDRVIRLSSGRVILPTALHKDASDTGSVVFFVSDDDCESFREIKQHLELPFTHSFSGLQEPGIVELSDKRLWAWARTAHAYQFEAYSSDGGESWSDVRPNEFFTSPLSPMSVKKLNDGKLVAIFNPIPNYNTRFEIGDDEDLNALSYKKQLYHPFSVYSGRTPYVVAVGKEDSKGFCPRVQAIEDAPGASFCYAAMLERRSYLLVSYFVNNQKPVDKVNCPTFGIVIKKIDRKELDVFQ